MSKGPKVRALARPFVAVIALTALMGAQDRLPVSATGVIAGRVTESQTGAPMAAIRVHLSQINPPTGQGARFDTTQSDAAGGFAFRDLPSGTFTVTASAVGYLAGAIGMRRPMPLWLALGAGERLENASIEMWQEATISGVVLNEKNEPLTGVDVEAWRRVSVGGVPVFDHQVLSSRTDEHGVYRIHDLAPGEYVVVLRVLHETRRVTVEPPSSSCVPAVPPPDPAPGTTPATIPMQTVRFSPAAHERPPGTIYGTLPRGLPRPADTDGQPRTYETLFFPNATDVSQAERMRLGAGAARSNVDFQLRAVTPVALRGRLVRPSRRAIGNRTRVTLRRAEGSPDHAIDASASLDEKQSFTFADVPPGRYTLEVTLASGTGCDVIIHAADDVVTRMPVDVTRDGLDDLVVPVAEGLSVSGRVVFNGSKPRPTSIILMLASLERLDARPVPSGRSEGSTLEVSGVSPGRYVVRPFMDDRDTPWFFESITAGGRDLTAEPLTVDAFGISDLVVTLTDWPPRLAGTVVGSSGDRVADATVVTFPTDPRLLAHAHEALARFATTRALQGKYTLDRLIPGEYLVAAVDERRMDDWPSATLRRALQATATRIRVEKGSQQTLTLVLR